MRTFRSDAKFDVVSCLFSAIGHLRSERDLLRAFTNFAHLLRPGGVALVEPWLDPAQFRPGYVHLVSHQGPDLTVVRLSDSVRRGNRSIVRFHYLIAERGRKIRHVEVDDLGLMVPRRRLMQLLREAGFSPRFIPEGLTAGRGLLVGRKPGPLRKVESSRD